MKIENPFLDQLREMPNWRSKLTSRQRILVRRNELSIALLSLMRLNANAITAIKNRFRP